jgi:hypothetical protein
MRAAPHARLLFLLLTAATTIFGARVSKKWDGLITSNPFGRDAPVEENKPEPPPSLELRGVVVESGVAWFTFFDSTSKKWTTIREGEEEGTLRVRAYDKSREAVTLEYQGRVTSLALKEASTHSYGPAPVSRQSLAAAPSLAPPGTVPVVVTAAMPAAEVRRIQQVSDEIQQRRAERRRL